MLLASITATGAADDIVAAVAGRKVRVWFIQWTMDGTGTASIHAGAAGATTRLVYGDYVAGGGGVLDLTKAGGWTCPTANTALQGTTSAANLKGVVGYDLV
jgi:hypothetical protein